jgi:hypothetical protein
MLAARAEAQFRAGVYARLSETYDAAESVPTQLERGTDHAQRRGWMVAATFKDDGWLRSEFGPWYEIRTYHLQ